MVSIQVLAIRSEGCSQRLHVAAATLSNSGVHTCHAGYNAASFRVTVSCPGNSCPHMGLTQHHT